MSKTIYAAKPTAGICLLFATLCLLIQGCASRGYLQGSVEGYHETTSGPSYPESSPDKDDLGINLGLIMMGVPEPPEAYRGSANLNYIQGNDIVYAANNLNAAYLSDKAPLRNVTKPATPAYNFMDHLNYMGGFEFITKNSNDGGTNIRLNYLEVPFYGIYQERLLSGIAFGGLGPYVAYGIGGSTSDTFNNKTTSMSSFDSTNGLKRFDAGLDLTLGYRVHNSFYFNLVYSHGFANTLRNSFGDKTRNAGFSLNFGYPISNLVKLVKK